MSNAEFTAQVECRPIPGFDGYFISKSGVVYSCRYGRRMHPLRPVLADGYYSVSLKPAVNAPARRKAISTLLALAFPEDFSKSIFPDFPKIEGERFVHLPGKPGYAACTNGTIWSCRKKGAGALWDDTWRTIPAEIANAGYGRVLMTVNGRRKKYSVHRLIVEAFIGAIPRGMQIRHFPDATKTNCRLENLLVGTSKQNNQDKIFHGTIARGESHGNAVLTEASVREIRKLLSNGILQKDIAASFQIGQTTVSKIKHRESWGWLQAPSGAPSIR